MYTTALSVLALVGVAQSHMSMFYPAPLGGAPSINKQSTELDPEFNYPLGCCGADGPTKPSPGLCRGHLDKFDTEEAAVTWTAGQDAYFQLTDYSYDPNAPGSTHYGGSCQVGFSVDKGATWKVAASYHGACPHATEDGSPEAQTFDFKVPSDIPTGDILFSWNWLNREHESFMSCSKVKIVGGGSGDSPSPSAPSQPISSATTPKQPSQSSAQPQQPDDDETTSAPVTSTRAGGRPPTTTTTVATTIYRTQPTETPASDNEEAEDEDSQDSEYSDWWSNRPHRKVKEGSRRYQVNGTRCECRRDELTLAARCSCNAEEEKRSEVERKALRMHRRTFYKRVDACNWATAPAMEVSYYTSDAKCAPNAKINNPSSDDFEIKWDVSCGVVEGTSEYPLKTMECGMYGA